MPLYFPPASSGSGDMEAATYDPQEIEDDAFDRANHTGSQTASTISDFDTEVSNNTDVAANTAARHSAVTVSDSSEIDLTLTGQQISASIVSSSIDETKLDASVNESLDLADSAVQDLSDLGVTATASELNTLDGITATTTELNYTDGVTSALQTQIDAKASSSDLTTHISDTTTHGTTGNIVGTTDSQTLTNKTIDGDDNTLSDIPSTALKENYARGRYQDNTSNSTETGITEQWGWGYMLGDGDFICSEAVTFPVAYSELMSVTCNVLGFKNTTNPSSISDFTADAITADAQVPTTTGFTAVVQHTSGTAIATTRRVGYSWIAKGIV